MSSPALYNIWVTYRCQELFNPDVIKKQESSWTFECLTAAVTLSDWQEAKDPVPLALSDKCQAASLYSA